MKNIHILPTDQPSRLLFNSLHKSFSIQKEKDGMYINDGKVISADFWGLEKASNNGFTPQHIYITSSEEIKEGDWYLDDTLQIRNALSTENDWKNSGKIGYNLCLKIILTTDPTLIADGVQSIDDEFLEWFVKNPTCEWVEVEKENICARCHSNDVDECWSAKECSNGRYDKIRYKIIITSLDAQMLDKIGSEEPKQETLEEAAEKYSEDGGDEKSFIAGSKYMAERMYSKEDLREAFKQSRQCKIFEKDMPPVYETFEEWFEQFKKK
jgi:hypothetical protein